MPRDSDRTSHSTRRERLTERSKRNAPARPTDVQALFELAVHEHRNGNLKRARQLYENILQVAESPQVTCNLATVLRAQGELDRAEAQYRAAIDAKPDFAEAYGGLGNVLRDTGRLEESLEVYGKALDLNPAFVEAHVNLGNVQQGLGRYDEAAAHYEAALQQRPEDEETRFTLAAVRGESRGSAPAAYARNLFDSYAARFDEHLVADLQYRVPTLIRKAVDSVMDPGARPERLRVADLGCGTGLCAAAVADLAASIHGVDLAPKMVAKSRERGIYDEVVCGDIVPFLQQRPGAFDLALAGDVFIYVGDMAPTLAALRTSLDAGGFFAFSVESQEDDGFSLLPTARFAHSAVYVERLAGVTGFSVSSRDDITVRIDRGHAIPGYLYVLRRA